MAVQVFTDHSRDDYYGATKWHIDQTGALHVIKSEDEEETAVANPFQSLPVGNVASYPGGSWTLVRRSPEVTADAADYLKAIGKLQALGAIPEELAQEAIDRTLTLVAEMGKGERA